MTSSLFAAITGLVGGLGLFMLGMQLMTDGLKLAAGSTLRRILENSTRTPLTGILSGALITSLVQSSSAVTVAVIGFVNAGLMNLRQAITVIYGTNIGTTVTAWLVAFIGFQVEIKVFALPAVGIGMLLRLMRGSGGLGSLGEALAGFGVFFLGIDILKEAFTGISAQFALGGPEPEGLLGILLYLGIGFLLTLAMQSSSAAIALALTAVASGLFSLQLGAAVIIGAKIGTTSTAALAVIGATPNAKRVASAHVVFNLLSGLAALLLLPLLLQLISQGRLLLGLEPEPTKILALFHTAASVQGVLLILPLTPALVKFLKKRFRTVEEDEGRTKYLDQNIVATPVLAVHALALELGRIGTIARRLARAAISSETGPTRRMATENRILLRLTDKTGEFVNLLRHNPLPRELDEKLPNTLRISGYYNEVAEMALAIAQLHATIRPLSHEEVAQAVSHYRQGVIKLLDLAEPEREGFNPAQLGELAAALEEEYQALKAMLLRAGTKSTMAVTQVFHLLEEMSHIRRIVDQAEKGARYLAALIPAPTSETPPAAEADSEAPAKPNDSPST